MGRAGRLRRHRVEVAWGAAAGLAQLVAMWRPLGVVRAAKPWRGPRHAVIDPC